MEKENISKDKKRWGDFEGFEKLSKTRKYTEMIGLCYSLTLSLPEEDEMKKYLATVALRVCQALSETLQKENNE